MNLPFETSEQVGEVAEAMLQPYPVYPNLVEFLSEHVVKPGYDYGDESEYGLDFVLDGLEQGRARGGMRSTARGTTVAPGSERRAKPSARPR